jgi:multiple sugar transport system permease protein
MRKLNKIFTRIAEFYHKIYNKRNRYKKLIGQIVVYVLLITISYVFLFPLFSMVSLAFMSPDDIINPEIDWLPQSFYLGNFAASIKVLNAGKALFNSIWFSGLLALAQTFVSALTGYAFARYEFRFKKILFALILVSFIVPVPVILIPRIMMIASVQDVIGTPLIGTVYPQIVMAIFGQGVNSAILILIFYNFFKMIPTVLFEAAKIDGASALDQFWHITIKMSLSTIVVVLLFSFVWNWNETYVTGLLLRNNTILLPTQLGIFDSIFTTRPPEIPGQGGEARLSEAYKMAATLLTMVPLFIIYFAAQKQFVEGIEKTGITGE